MKKQSFDQLMAQGTQAYKGEDPSVFHFLVTQLLNGSHPVNHSLAEAIYYREGHKLALGYQFRQMTRFQKAHEILAFEATGQSNITAQATDFELDVKLQCLVNQYHEDNYRCSSSDDGCSQSETERDSSEGSSGSESESESESESQTKIDDSSPSEVPDDNNPVKDSNGRLIIKTWRPALGRSVRMVY